MLQDKLLFFPQSIPDDRRRALAGDPHITPLVITAQDGTRLSGWLRHPDGKGPWPVLLYFGGNADEASLILDYADDWPQWAIATLNYRGYGDSGGKPAEDAMKDDAQRLFDYLASRPDIRADQIIAIGRSLGSGVAVALAAKRKLNSLVLVTPYDSLPSVAVDHFPWVPTGLLMSNRFDSLALAPSLTTPAIFLVADQDEVIGNPHSRTLFDAWAGPKTWVLVENAHHGDILNRPGYRTALAAFLNERLGNSATRLTSTDPR